MSQITQEMADVLRFVKTFDLKSTNDVPLSTFDEHEDNNDEAADNLTKLRVIFSSNVYINLGFRKKKFTTYIYLFSFFSLKLDEDDETEHMQQNQATSLLNTRYSIGNFDMTLLEKPSWLQEPNEKNVLLEDRLENDNEFDITGILNLSCMHVTDNDLPSVIQRAFWAGPKKCTGLLLRDNALTADGVRMIVDTILAGRTSLRYLSFSSNPDIGDAGIEHIVRLLQKNRSMIFLALPATGMTDRGVKLLADVLCGADSESNAPPPLKKLYISFNKAITDESLESLLQILEQNQYLKVLSLQHCSLSDEAHRTLKQAARRLKKKKFSLTG
jgi:hypothetical protein